MVGEVVSQDDYFCWSLTQLSREFGIARETVTRRLEASGVKSAGSRRGYPVYRVGQAAEAILVPPAGQGGFVNDPDKMAPKERADWFKSENDRLKFERESGVSIHSIDAREQMALIAKTGLQVLETLPDILERDFNLDTEVIINVESKIDALRVQWANMINESDEYISPQTTKKRCNVNNEDNLTGPDNKTAKNTAIIPASELDNGLLEYLVSSGYSDSEARDITSKLLDEQ